MNEETQAYFDKLPHWLRENILQSGVSFSTRNELEKIAQNFLDDAKKMES